MTNEQALDKLLGLLADVWDATEEGSLARMELRKVSAALQAGAPIRAALSQPAIERTCPLCGGQTVFTPLGEPLAEGWAWPDEPKVDEYGNEYFCVYLSGRHSSADRYVAVLPAEEEKAQ